MCFTTQLSRYVDVQILLVLNDVSINHAFAKVEAYLKSRLVNKTIDLC
ncbi:MAG: hypothetical protein ACJAXY_001382 [Nonlabens sp.]|jgi:hypothetical protein